MIAYLEEAKRGRLTDAEAKRMLEISLIVAEFSYAELPLFYSRILGVTGTLKQMSVFKKEELRQRYSIVKQFYIPSVYGDSKKRRTVSRKVVPIDKHTD